MKRVPSFILLFVLMTVSFSPGQDYRDVTPDNSTQMPEDLYFRKDYRVQWWYFTGHLFTEEGREFGYELTFFVLGVQQKKYTSRFGLNNVYMSHFAISDIGGGMYYFREKIDGGAFGFAGASDDALRVWIDRDSLEGSMEGMHIEASAEEMEIELDLVPKKPVVLNGKRGYSRKSEESPLIASLYVSFTHLVTTGKLRIGDDMYHLTGKSWFDREISSRGLSADQQGWDWFSIQLNDGREMMLYVMRKKDGSVDPYSAGTFVYRDGEYRHLTGVDFTVTVIDHYRSEKTGARYPSRWEVSIPSEKVNLTIIPLLQDQEFIGSYSTWNRYWEGACIVNGSAEGRAYVEMTGYGENR